MEGDSQKCKKNTNLLYENEYLKATLFLKMYIIYDVMAFMYLFNSCQIQNSTNAVSFRLLS